MKIVNAYDVRNATLDQQSGLLQMQMNAVYKSTMEDFTLFEVKTFRNTGAIALSSSANCFHVKCLYMSV